MTKSRLTRKAESKYHRRIISKKADKQNVVWKRLDVEYPLSIGVKRFSPDRRISVNVSKSDAWLLQINRSRESDSGIYICSTTSPSRRSITKSVDNRRNLDESSRQEEETGALECRYNVSVVNRSHNERFQVDSPVVEPKSNKPVKSISLTGDKLVFYGTSMQLSCRVNFTSNEAKSQANNISIEWYQNGVRRSSRRQRQAQRRRRRGLVIREYWIDSHLLESRLTIYRVSELDAGAWICLERSRSLGHPWSQKEQPQSRDLVYDRITVEVIVPYSPPTTADNNDLSSSQLSPNSHLVDPRDAPSSKVQRSAMRSHPRKSGVVGVRINWLLLLLLTPKLLWPVAI